MFWQRPEFYIAPAGCAGRAAHLLAGEADGEPRLIGDLVGAFGLFDDIQVFLQIFLVFDGEIPDQAALAYSVFGSAGFVHC